MAHDCDGLAELHGEGNILENPLDARLRRFEFWLSPLKPRAIDCRLDRSLLLIGQLLIGEPHVAELNAIAAVSLDGVRGADDLRLRV